jgi:hypothetical protein
VLFVSHGLRRDKHRTHRHVNTLVDVRSTVILHAIDYSIYSVSFWP